MRRAAWLFALSACSFDKGQAVIDARGDGDAPDTKIDTPSGCRAVALDADGAHTCVARDDGSVRCWGKNGQGELGRPPLSRDTCMITSVAYACEKTPIDPMVPVAVTTLGLADQHSCAIGGAKVYCWGANDSGQFGSGNNGDKYAPFEVTARAGATEIAGGNTHTCSLASGTLSCSGGNNEGEVGNNSTANAFTPYPSRNGVPTFGVGFQNVYALTISGDVYGWGDNALHQIDSTATDPRTVPSQVPGITGANAVAGGFGHACAVLGNQTAACWGSNGNGQLGRGFASVSEGPGAVMVITGTINELSAGANHTCVRRSDNTVACWGEGYLNGVVIALPRAAARITSGSYHDCALLDDGTVWCWGSNPYGQLGNGTTNSSIDNTAVQVPVCP